MLLKLCNLRICQVTRCKTEELAGRQTGRQSDRQTDSSETVEQIDGQAAFRTAASGAGGAGAGRALTSRNGIEGATE